MRFWTRLLNKVLRRRWCAYCPMDVRLLQSLDKPLVTNALYYSIDVAHGIEKWIVSFEHDSPDIVLGIVGDHDSWYYANTRPGRVPRGEKGLSRRLDEMQRHMDWLGGTPWLVRPMTPREIRDAEQSGDLRNIDLQHGFAMMEQLKREAETSKTNNP